MPSSQVKTKDKGYNRLMRRAKAVGSGQLSVGIHPREGRKRYASGKTVSQVARLHISGTGRMPARPFLPHWAVEQNGLRRIRDATRNALQASLRTGKSPKIALERAGGRYVAQIRETFSRMTRLAASTIRQKRSRAILIRTGQMRDSIGFRISVERPKPGAFK